jgi:hypothetical protein
MSFLVTVERDLEEGSFLQGGGVETTRCSFVPFPSRRQIQRYCAGISGVSGSPSTSVRFGMIRGATRKHDCRGAPKDFATLDIFIVPHPRSCILVVFFVDMPRTSSEVVDCETVLSMCMMSPHLCSPRGNAQRRSGFIWLVFASKSQTYYDAEQRDPNSVHPHEPTGNYQMMTFSVLRISFPYL